MKAIKTPWNRLFEPVDIASLVAFRVAFGVLMLEEALRYLGLGLARELYVEPRFHFTYFGFDWVRPWPGPDAWPSLGMELHMAALGVLAVMIAVGLYYRVAATLFFVGFTYVFLLDQARYLNHYYLVCLVAFLMIFLPADRSLSYDARRVTSLASETVPAWPVWLLRAQIALVYFYAGVAKLNPDWLQGQPLLMWLDSREDYALIGSIVSQDWVAYVMSYGGLILDLVAAPLLLWRRSRLAMFAVVLLFHLTNLVVFSIGVFPWFMVAATTIFFEPDWPRRVARVLSRLTLVATNLLLFFSERRESRRLERLSFPAASDGPAPPPAVPRPSATRRRMVVTALALYLIVQVLVPLRHFLYPGDVNWTEEGHRFSWRMKLRSKRGWSQFVVLDPATGETWTIDPADPESEWGLTPSAERAVALRREGNDEPGYLTSRQVRKLGGLPDLVLQFSHHLAERFREAGYPDVEVRAWVRTSLNGRPPRLLVDPNVDLAAQPRTLWPAPWIRPLEGPPGEDRSSRPRSPRARSLPVDRPGRKARPLPRSREAEVRFPSGRGKERREGEGETENAHESRN